MSSRARLLRHPLAIAGVILTTVSAVVFAALLVAMLSGAFFNNPYAGLVVFIVVPALLVLGLLLIPRGCGASTAGCSAMAVRHETGPSSISGNRSRAIGRC